MKVKRENENANCTLNVFNCIVYVEYEYKVFNHFTFQERPQNKTVYETDLSFKLSIQPI